MKKLLLLVLIVASTTFKANAQFSDSFSDGDFTLAPEWSGDVSKFEVEASHMLHLNAPAVSSSAYLSTPSTAIAEAQWQWYHEISENPSSTNFSKIYLVADQPNLSSTLSGYFIKVGGTPDEVSLYRQDGNTEVLLIDGLDGRVNTKPVEIEISVVRDESGNWSLSVKPATEPEWIVEGTAFDDTYTSSAYFGIYCQYTATRSSAFFFDNFQVSGSILADNTPPNLQSHSLLSDKLVQITFSEILESGSALNPANYLIHGANPQAVNYANDTLLLELSQSLPNGIPQELVISGLTDLEGNIMAETTVNLLYFDAHPAGWESILINELLPDPTPAKLNLPDASDAEFIELYNPGPHPFQLESWTLNDRELPAFILLPDQYLILSIGKFAEAYGQYGNVITPASWPTLSNSGGSLVLKDAAGTIVDSMSYSAQEVGEGIALERVYVNKPCGIATNFKLSVGENGASPGEQNTVFSDLLDVSGPTLQLAEALSYDSIILEFDEKVYFTEPAKQYILINEQHAISALHYLSQDSTKVLLLTSIALMASKTNEITVEQVSDCQGNSTQSQSISFYVDLDHPVIEAIRLLDTAQIEIRFNERLVKSDAERESNYLLSPWQMSPDKATMLDDSISVQLSFDISLETETSFELIISNVRDLFGNQTPAEPSSGYSFVYRNDIDTINIINEYQLDLFFEQAVDRTSLSIEHFSIDRNVGQPAQVKLSQQNDRQVHLLLKKPLVKNRQHLLRVQNILSREGTLLSTPVSRFFYDTRAPLIEEIRAISDSSLEIIFDEKIYQSEDQPLRLFLDEVAVDLVSFSLQENRLLVELGSPLLQEKTYRIGINGLTDEQFNPTNASPAFSYYNDQLSPQLDTAFFLSAKQVMLVFHEPILQLSQDEDAYFQIKEPEENSFSIQHLLLQPEKIILSITSSIDIENIHIQIDNLSDLNHNMMSEPIQLRLQNTEAWIGSITPLSDQVLNLQFSRETGNLLPSQFLLDENIVPDSIQFISAGEVNIYFNSKFQNGISYQLSFHFNDKVQVLEFSYDDFVAEVKLVGNNSLLIQWEVAVSEASVTDVFHYTADQHLHPLAIVHIKEENSTQLLFNHDFDPATLHTLRINNIENIDGFLLPASEHLFGKGHSPGAYDLIITEIMADPTPAQGLPESEYLEIFNTSERPVNLNGIRLSDGKQTATLTDEWILPGAFLILCPNSSLQSLSAYGQSLGVSSFPDLNAAGDVLELIGPTGQLIHRVAYSIDWYNDSFKKEGGWSLEMIDVNYPCRESENWIVSVDTSGGSPGRKNSVEASNPDQVTPILLQAIAEDSLTIWLQFDERLAADAAEESMITADGLQIKEILLTPDAKSMYLLLDYPLEKGKNYNIQIQTIADCSGNVAMEQQQKPVIIPENAERNDILISEILFQPRAGGVDFVELYNNSSKYINLKNWKLAELKGDNPEIFVISQQTYILSPGSYLALTAEPETLKADYAAAVWENLLEMPDFPSLLSDGSRLQLLDAQQDLMQQVDYDPDWHHPLLQETRGVSLERISWLDDENNPQLWQSAASTAGFATPGLRNSQWQQVLQQAHTLEADPAVFFPDQSGYRDYTKIYFNSSSSGRIGNLRIYDAKGNLVRRLAENYSLAEKGFFSWDGTDDRQQRVKNGYYIIWLESFDLQGDTNVHKTKVVVGSTF